MGEKIPGTGQLFSDPNVNAAREFFKNKSRTMTDKRMSVSEAVTNFSVRKKEVIANTGFEMLFAERVLTTEEPTERELKILREEIDPEGIIIGKQGA